MEIDDKWTPNVGHPLAAFRHGDCVRLVESVDRRCVGLLYLVILVDGEKLAANLTAGSVRTDGKFLLVPHAKVVTS